MRLIITQFQYILQQKIVAEKHGGEKIGLLRWIAAGAAATVIGPLAVPILVAGNWDGIDGYDGGCDE